MANKPKPAAKWPEEKDFIFGQRLSQAGFVKMCLTDTPRKFEIPNHRPGKVISRFAEIEVPFYVSKNGNYIFIFDKGVTFLIDLYGSLDEWLKKF